jgi:VWFA-related protein
MTASGQTAAKSAQFPAHTDLVQIQVSVVDSKGQPVRDLTQRDFEISENGGKQTITLLERTSLAVERATLPEVEMPDRAGQGQPIQASRLKVMVVDDAFLRQSDISRAMLAVHAIVASAGDGDQVILLAPMTKLEAVAEMPAGRAAFLERAEGLRLLWGVDRSSLPRFASELRVRQQIVIDALCAALDFCARQSKPKMIFLISRGFRYVTEDRANHDAVLRSSRAANVPVHFVDVRGLEVLSDSRPPRIPGMPAMPPLGPDPSQGTDFTDSVALDTGGVIVRGTNDPTNPIRRLIAERSFYYTIGYTPIDPPRHGEFRRVTVHVSRPGVRVYARPGYIG